MGARNSPTFCLYPIQAIVFVLKISPIIFALVGSFLKNLTLVDLETKLYYLFRRFHKSDSARVLSFVKVTETTVLLFSIFLQVEVDNLTDKHIIDFIKDDL